MPVKHLATSDAKLLSLALVPRGRNRSSNFGLFVRLSRDLELRLLGVSNM